MKKALLISLIFSTITNLFGQVPIIQTPQPATFGNFGNQNFFPNQQTVQPDQNLHDQQKRIQQQNQMLMQQQNPNVHRGLPADIQQDITDAQKQFAYQDRKRLAQQLYTSAFTELKAMIEGKTQYDLKKAIFLVENTFVENSFQYIDFERFIHNEVVLVKHLMQEKGYALTDRNALALTLQKVMNDTITYTQNGQKMVHYPYRYDFEDFWGTEDYTKMFVLKLLQTRSGQCHSMPLLFKILADEVGLPAYISFAPNHSYIQIKDNQNNLLSYETTNGHFVSEAWVLASGYIKSPTLKHRIYTDTLSQTQTLLHCLTDLAAGYLWKFGYENTDLVKQCYEFALKLDNKNLKARMIKANVATYALMKEVKLQGNPPKSEIHKYPTIQKLYNEMHATYKVLDDWGFEEIPAEVYAEWLKSAQKEQYRQKAP